MHLLKPNLLILLRNGERPSPVEGQEAFLGDREGKQFRSEYEDIESTTSNPDLHSGEYCVDVSSYGMIMVNKTRKEKCKTVYDKDCKPKREKVGSKKISLLCIQILFAFF